MLRTKLILSLLLFVLIGSILLSISCGGTGETGTQPPPPPPSGSDTAGIFFAGSVGGQILGMSVRTGTLAKVSGSSISLSSGMRSFSADPSGTVLVAISLPSSTPEAQIVNVQPRGALTAGPTIQLTGNSEGSAILNGRIAIVDSDHNKVNLYGLSGGNVDLISSADTDGEPSGVLFDAAGKHLYVANLTGGTITVFSVSTSGDLLLQQTVPLYHSFAGPLASPKQIRLNAAGTQLAASAFDSVFVWNVNSNDGTLTSPTWAFHDAYEGYITDSFQELTFDPTGTSLYVVESTNNVIYVFSVSDAGLSLLRGSQFMPAGQATGITTNASGDRIYVLEILSQVETFVQNSSNGQWSSKEFLLVDAFFLPGQILRIQAR